MANEHLFRPRLGGASTYEGAQADPALSLGGFQSPTTIAAYEGAVTGVNSDREIVDSSLPGTDFTGGWVVFLDTNLNEAREITNHDTGTDTLTFREVFPTTPVVTDRYWVFTKNGYFSAFTADHCRRRATRHRLAYMKNETGAQLHSTHAYIVDLDAGPLICEVAMSVFDFPMSNHQDLTTLSDEEAAPVLTVGSPEFGSNTQDFKRPRSYDRAVNSPFGSDGSGGQKSIRQLASNRAERAFWIRLSFDVDSPIPLPSTAVFQVFIDSDDGTTTSSMIIVVDLDGVPETITPVIDRRLRIAGGAVASCIVLDSVAPFEPVPGRTFLIELTSGPGSLNAQSDTVQRPVLPNPQDAIPIRRVYVAPTDPAQEGVSVVFGFEVT